MLDIEAISKFLASVVEHYEKSAPTVSAWAEDVYGRLREDVNSVRVGELTQSLALLEEGIWEHPNYAANRVYHLMSALGQDTTGHAGF